MKKGALIVSLLLAGVITYEWLSWPERHRQGVNVVAADSTPKENPITREKQQILRQEPQAYLAIAHKTLFRADRQGVQAQADERQVQRSQPGLPKIRLLGVVLTENQPPSAMIFDEKSKQTRVYHIGDELGSWKLQEISSGFVLLSWDDQQEKILLRKY
jgi:type II secretory pathway component PulC